MAARREARALAAVAVLLAVFCALLAAIRGTLLPGWDLAVTRALQRERNGPLDMLAEALTFAGGFAVIAPFGCLVALRLWRDRRPRTAALLAAAALLGHPLNMAIKLIARRPRPTEDAVDVLMAAGGTSFPSGHAMATILLFGFLAVLSSTMIFRGRARHAAVAACVLFTLGVGVSRIYVGGHWLSDVVGGWACGLLLLLIWTELHRLWAAGEIAPRPTAEGVDAIAPSPRVETRV
jgi:undecaprenyl-diphosphatase